MLRTFRRFQIRGVRTGCLYHFRQFVRILQHRTRFQIIVVERHISVVCHEQRTLHSLQQCFFPNVRIRIMDEGTRIDVAVRIDVKVSSSAGNASVNVFAVILEIDDEQRIFRTILPHAVHGFHPLFRCRQQLRRSIVAHRHVVEEPGEEGTHILQAVQKFLRCNGFEIDAGVAAGESKRKPVTAKNIAGVHYLIVYTHASSAVCRLAEAFNRNTRDEVLHPKHLFGKFIIDQRAVCKSKNYAVIVFLAKLDDILLSYHRLSAGQKIEVHAHILSLTHDVVQFFKRQVQLIAVFRRPATGAVQVAGTGGIHQNCPRNIAVQFVSEFIFSLPSGQACVQEKISQKCLCYIRIDVVDNMGNILLIRTVLILQLFPNRSSRADKIVSRKLIRPVHNLHKILIRILICHINRPIQTKLF